jgi:hypothetical protein
MNIEKTIEFILDMQAKAEERFAKAEERFVKSERRLDRMERVVAQNNRLVARLARAGVALRSEVRRHERAIVRIEENLAEATDKLNVLIDIVEKNEKWQAKAEEKLARRDKFQARTDENLMEITDKLNALTDLVDKSLRRNGGAR